MSCQYPNHNKFEIFYICPSCKGGYSTQPFPKDYPCGVCGNFGMCKAIAKLVIIKKVWRKPKTWKHDCYFVIKKWLEAIPSEVVERKD
jgi:hypothetical protein